MNWRCPINPRAGGAEAVTFEVARRLAARGDSVEWFSADFRGASAEEYLDGVRIVRAGRQSTVHWHAYWRYRNRLSSNFDVVVDQVNTIPFFTPLWADIPVLMFIHQLAREVWWYESPFPISLLGFSAEPLCLRVYRRSRVITVSESSSTDLRRLGFVGPIVVIPQGLEPLTSVPRETGQTPRVLYVGRLSPSKRVTDIIKAFAGFQSKVVDATLHLIGEGSESYVRKLRALAQNLGVADRITFKGRVSTADKHLEMASAHMLVLASAREGWGLVVTEANAFGTPAVAYDVPGLRDSIRRDDTGLLVPPRPSALADAMVRLWRDSYLHERLSTAARIWAAAFSFDAMAAAFHAELSAAVDAKLSAKGQEPVEPNDKWRSTRC